MTDYPQPPSDDPWANQAPPPPPPTGGYQAPESLVPPSPAPGMYPQAVPNESTAQTALILGVIGLCVPILGIVAVFMGLSAIKKIDESMGTLGGKPMATGAIVLGGLEILAVLFIVVL